MGSPGFGIYNVENLWPGRWGGRTSGMGSAPQRDMIDYDVLLGPKVRPAPKLAVNPPPSVAPPSPEELAQLLGVGKERSLNDAIVSNREPTGNLANILRGYGLHGSLDVQSDEGPPVMSDTQFGRGGVRPGTVVRGVGDPAEGMAAEARRAAIDQGFRQRAAEDEARRYQQYAWEREGKIPQAVMPRPVPEIPGAASAVQAVSGEMTAPQRVQGFIDDAVGKAKGALQTAPITGQTKDIEAQQEAERWSQPGQRQFRQAQAEETARRQLEPGPVSELSQMLFERQLALERAQNQGRFGFGSGVVPSSASVEGAPTAEGQAPMAAGRRVTRAEIMQEARSRGYNPQQYEAFLKSKGYQILP